MSSPRSILAKLFYIICFIPSSFSIFAQNKDKFNIGLIGFYNLENLYDTVDQDNVNDEEFTPNGSRRYTSEIYLDKLTKLDKVLTEMGTDHNPEGIAVLGVAEIENRSVLRDLCNQKGISPRQWKIVHYDSKDPRGVDVGLLYNPKYFKVLKSDRISVDMEDLGEGKTRDILWVKGLFMGEEIHILVSHWPSRRGGEEASMKKRCRAAEIMRAKTDSILSGNPNANVIAMGDLNDDPTSPSVVNCLKSTGKKEDTAYGKFYNPFYDYFKKGIGTLAYADAWNLFDQILISPSMLSKNNRLIYGGSHIFSRSYMLQLDGQYKGYPLRTYNGDIYQGGFSDHFPTYILLKKKVN